MVMTIVEILISFPEEALAAAKIPLERAKEECQKMLALELYRKGRLSLGKACEVAGISQWEFLELNREERIPLNYNAEDLEEDRKLLQDLFK